MTPMDKLNLIVSRLQTRINNVTIMKKSETNENSRAMMSAMLSVLHRVQEEVLEIIVMEDEGDLVDKQATHSNEMLIDLKEK